MHSDSVFQLGRASREEFEKDALSSESVRGITAMRLSLNLVRFDPVPKHAAHRSHATIGAIGSCAPSREEIAILKRNDRRMYHLLLPFDLIRRPPFGPYPTLATQLRVDTSVRGRWVDQLSKRGDRWSGRRMRRGGELRRHGAVLDMCPWNGAKRRFPSRRGDRYRRHRWGCDVADEGGVRRRRSLRRESLHTHDAMARGVRSPSASRWRIAS